MNGWMGKIIAIDLGTLKQESVEVDEATRRRYIGGRGLGVKLYSDLFPRPIDPFADENALIFMTGPLTGTLMTSGRYQVISRSPLTGTICDSSSGGVFGQALKAAGLDGLIVRGRSPKPVYLSVREGEVEVRDASALWGLDTQQTQKAVQAELATKASVACIGPAGENRILFAAIMNDKDRAAGRGGLGAIMGAKNLKAVAASWARPFWSTSSTPTACSRPRTSVAACSTTPKARAAKRSPSRCWCAKAPAISARSAAAEPRRPGT
jgi:aldehyde:ferredoxin oxidoreductase